MLCLCILYISNELHDHGPLWKQFSVCSVIEEFKEFNLIKYMMRSSQIRDVVIQERNVRIDMGHGFLKV